jgi:hypothetical protein
VSDLSKCGFFDCPGSVFADVKKPPIATVYLLCGIYIGFALFAAFLIFALLDRYNQIGLVSQDKSEKKPLKALINTIKHLKHLNQLLFIPMSIWLGFEQAFIGADFTKVRKTNPGRLQALSLTRLFSLF